MSSENTPEQETDFLSPLSYKDIEEKIQVNLKDHNITLEEFRMRLSIELHQTQRMKLRILIQEQNYLEQLSYLDYKIRAQANIGLVKRINGELEK